MIVVITVVIVVIDTMHVGSIMKSGKMCLCMYMYMVCNGVYAHAHVPGIFHLKGKNESNQVSKRHLTL